MASPIIRGTPRLMDARIFRDEPMHLRSTIVDTPLASRFHYDAAQNLFFIDFEPAPAQGERDRDIRALVETSSRPSAARCRRWSTTTASTSRTTSSSPMPT
jgi:propionate CoA-transferase